MELAALAILGAAGFVLAKQTAPAPVYPTKNSGANPVARPGIGVKEAFANQTQRNVSNLGTSLRGPNPQLDIMYNDLMGRGALNSQPNSLGGKLSYLPGNVASSTQPANDCDCGLE
jgi:hypothetical protein